MSGHNGFLARVQGFAHRYFLGLLVAAYLLAAVWPAPGNAVRHATVFDAGGGVVLTLPVALLAVLLFNAGLAADAADLAGVVRRPAALCAGVAATVAVPPVVVAGLAAAAGWWHDPDEARCLVAGLGIVAAMPVAGSSAAWSHRAGGCTALSLGLVVASTLLSPVTTPLALAVVDAPAGGSGAALGGAATVTFLVFGVVAPSVAGMAAGRWPGRWPGRSRRGPRSSWCCATPTRPPRCRPSPPTRTGTTSGWWPRRRSSCAGAGSRRGGRSPDWSGPAAPRGGRWCSGWG
ncbi:MAG TPA: bile acid:sodium symporter [Urbifossiella sp.]|nr:bile acid:sodium symporter [Urbifossiella sp.]